MAKCFAASCSRFGAQSFGFRVRASGLKFRAWGFLRWVQDPEFGVMG